MSEVWTQWEGELIAGAFPLLRFISASDHSAVFLTEHLARNLPRAAIKIIPADPATEAALLVRWRTAATLSHPHLIHLLDSGRCQVGDHQFLFVVMEYAGETLAEVLPSRALTYDEVREMLNPTLDVLTFLHRKELVQGHLKPSNILVVDDQPKLASDTICAFGDHPTSAVTSPYDSPETKEGKISAASDIWALGVTIVEALTQRPPAMSLEPQEPLSLPASTPPMFVDIVRRCLIRNPADRPTVIEMKSLITDAPAAPAIRVPPAEGRSATGRVAPHEKPIRRSALLSVGALVIVLIAVWAGLRLSRGVPHNPLSTSTTPTPLTVPITAAPPRQPDRAVRASADATPSVLLKEMPAVPGSATHTIRGHFNISVLVTVDRSGNVIDATLKNAGPSQYFARASTAAARKWRFVPVDSQDSRTWLLQFEFSRNGVTALAMGPRA
jgi:serine/threonine protein kinase